MQRNLLRALLLAMTVLLVGALPAVAQSEDEGWLLANEDDSVVIAVQRDVAVGPTEQADGILVVEGERRHRRHRRPRLSAADADVTISGSERRIEDIFIAGGTLTLEDGATVGDVYYTGTEISGSDDDRHHRGEIRDAEEELRGRARGPWPCCLIVLLIFVAIGGVHRHAGDDPAGHRLRHRAGPACRAPPSATTCSRPSSWAC